MLSTSLAVVAMSGLLASGTPSSPNFWQTDYRTALTQAMEQQKPIVVVFHKGGAAELFRENAVPTEALKAIKQSYISLSVDSRTAEGQQLVELFRIEEGLVISDKTGQFQALRYEGNPVAPEAIASITRYASISTKPVTTEYVIQPGLQPSQRFVNRLFSGTPIFQNGIGNVGLINPQGPINNYIVQPVTNVFNATRQVIGGS